MKGISARLMALIGLAVSVFTGPVIYAAEADSAIIQEMLSKMTLEEKATLVVGARSGGNVDPSSTIAAVGKIGAAGTTAEITRMGIPPMVLADGPAGLRINPTRPDDENTYYCTAFPIATLMASTWDTELVNKVGQAWGDELLEYGTDILLAPALNIHRNPLCGRNFEYYSEDPLVSGKITAALVKGIQSKGVGTSIKHFVANNEESNRTRINTIVSERALREIYLKGFRIAVQEAQPWTVMSSYNRLNGLYTSESYDLLTKVLRDDWGFKGFVMTDWGGGSDPIAQMKAGNDLLMPGNPDQSAAIVAAVNDGSLDIEVLNKNVERILNILLKTPRYKGYKFSNKPNLKANAQVSRQAATDGMVLLKNADNALPISGSVKKIAAYGITTYDTIKGGTGSGDVNAAYTVSLIDGLKKAGFIPYKELDEAYAAYLKKANDQANDRPRGGFWGRPRTPEMDITEESAKEAAENADLAVITIGRNSGEGSDRTVSDFDLAEVEKKMIQTVAKAFREKGKKTIVVLNIGGIIETASWRDIPDAILLAWQPGQEAGDAIADVLRGKVNPSGKLADSFPMAYSDVPSANNFPGTPTEAEKAAPPEGNGRNRGPSQVVYEEDIYVGYRYYDTFDKPIAYEFGYGLSYTTFDYSNMKLSAKSFQNGLTVSVDVKNSGTVAGREVVQLYLTAPANKLHKPRHVLVAFGKTRLLGPGQSETLTFELAPMDLASFDTPSSSWVAEAGKYTVEAAASSRKIKLTDTFTLARELMVQKVSQSLTPQVKINTLKP